MNKNYEVRNLLHSVGITPDVRGYFYLLDGITAVRDSFQKGKACESYVNLYEDIASKHDTIGTRVERCIRHCVIKAWANPTEKMKEVFAGFDTKPTNSAFISVLAEYLVVASEARNDV